MGSECPCEFALGGCRAPHTFPPRPALSQGAEPPAGSLSHAASSTSVQRQDAIFRKVAMGKAGEGPGDLLPDPGRGPGGRRCELDLGWRRGQSGPRKVTPGRCLCSWRSPHPGCGKTHRQDRQVGCQGEASPPSRLHSEEEKTTPPFSAEGHALLDVSAHPAMEQPAPTSGPAAVCSRTPEPLGRTCTLTPPRPTTLKGLRWFFLLKECVTRLMF